MGYLLLALQVMNTALAVRASLSSWQAIRNLQEYEQPTETAAKVSNIAADQLYKTRTTQASGVAALLLSTISSFTLAFFALRPTLTQLFANLAVLGAIYGARRHINAFYADKTSSVPAAKAYNRGVEASRDLVEQLDFLALGWGISAVLVFFKG